MLDCKEYGVHSLKTEIKGLQAILDHSINDTFNKVVETIVKTKGKIVLTGVGKPGYLARRVAATFASTGTMAMYVHPTEASHGDLGMILPEDTVIMLSNTGESKENKDIIAYCKRFDITLIGLTRNAEGFLAKSATIPVVLDKIEQTNIVNSPTTSEIMFLAYLDAVATALINVKCFNQDKFKTFHPGGKLGASLLKVDEIMHQGDELPLVHENDTMEFAIKTMIERPLGCIGILDKDENLVGIITDGDFKRQIIKHSDLMSKPLSDIMTKNPITVERNMFAIDAVKLMQRGVGNKNNYIQVLFVTDKADGGNKVVGLIHIQDCLRAGVI